MKLRSLLFLFSFILHFSCIAQQDFTPGTLVLNSGDTLRGLLKNITGRINPRTIGFKPTISAELKFYPAEIVKWFRYNGGEWYYGYVGSIETSSLNNNDLNYDSSMHTMLDTMFINAVIIGRASLYYAHDRNDRVHLFYRKFEDEIIELAYKKYYIDEIVLADYRNKITKRAIIASEVYKAQLMNVFSDCPYLATGIPSRALSYAASDLMSLFEEYNRCKAAKVVYRQPRDKGKLEVSVQAGLNSTGVELVSTYEPNWNQIQFDRGLGYQVGIGFNWLFPQLNKQWSINNEILIKEHHLEGRDTSANPVYYTLDATYLKIVSLGEYQPTVGNIRLIFGMGISNNFSLGYKTTGEPVTGPSIFGAYRNYEQGLVFNVGAGYKKFTGQVRLEKSNGWSDYSDLHTGFTTWYFQLGYIF